MHYQEIANWFNVDKSQFQGDLQQISQKEEVKAKLV